jgi:hypothetical protein
MCPCHDPTKEILMNFRILGLSPEPFQPLFGLTEQELARRGAKRYVADAKPGFPDRIEMRDAEPGEPLILVNYVHQSADTPYRASHAVFVREGAQQRYDACGEIPEVLARRSISLRAFDADHWMVGGELLEGRQLEPAIRKLLGQSEVAYLQAHYAVRGCYAARIERVNEEAAIGALR